MAISTNKTKLSIGDKEYAIKSFPSILGKRSALETTTMSDDAQTFIPGIRQQAETLDFGANYDSTVYSEINALSGDQACKLTFSDGSGYSWQGGVSATIDEGDVDAVIGMTISITPSTVPVWAKSAT